MDHFKTLIWLVPVVLLLHELEEWNILKWYDRNYVEMPPSTNLSIRVWLIYFSLLGFVWTFVSWLLPVYMTAFLMLILIGVTIQNGLQHLYWQYYFKEYSPGFIFSVLAGIPAGAYVVWRAVQEGYLSIWVVILVAVLFVPGLIETVKAKNRLTKSIRSAHNTGIKLSKKLFG